MRIRISVLAVVLCLLTLHTFAEDAAPQPAQSTKIRLIARADDMGAAQAINDGCIDAFQKGIVRSVEVIVPGPWFLDAVRLIKENPTVDVGVHLTLTSEWDNLKWRPMTNAPSLVDADGYFHATTSAFKSAGPKLDEVERELRAQIETARRHIGANRISHFSTHMGAANATPELKSLTQKLAKEYKLRTDDDVKNAGRFGDAAMSNDQREKALMGLLEKLQPGDWLLIEHPGFSTPEMDALGHSGVTHVSTDRSNVRRAFTSDRVLKIVNGRSIELIGYRDLGK